MITEKIKKTVKDVVKEKFEIEMDNIEIEHPADIKFGDYSVNVAFKLSKYFKKNPIEIAESVVAGINDKNIKEIEKTESAGAGFINFYLSKNFFKNSIGDILKEKKKWGSNKKLKDKKVVVEYTDTNPFKEFHIGHLMSNTIGESVSRIIDFSGAKVKRVNYQGDVGMHVAKAVWGILNSNLKTNDIKDIGKAYAKGVEAYENKDKAQKEIKEINKKIYEESDKKINSVYKKGKSTSLKKFEKIYKTLGTKFDRYFFESEVAGVGKKIVEENIETGIFEKSDEAVVFRGDMHGLHTRVFINSEKIPTYEAKEIGLAELKEKEISPDMSIVLTGNEIEEYFKVFKKVMEFINPSISAYTTHIPHGMMRFANGKISSREGSIPTAENLIENVYNSAIDKVGRGSKKTAKQVSIGAIKYSILKRSAGKDAIFDTEEALSFEGDSGAYLQYTYTRAKSVLEKAKKAKIKPNNKNNKNTETKTIERFLYRFPEAVEEASDFLEPRIISGYLTELASLFNSFYSNERIINKEDKSSPYKIAITKAVLITMENGLKLLGIEAPDKM